MKKGSVDVNVKHKNNQSSVRKKGFDYPDADTVASKYGVSEDDEQVNSGEEGGFSKGLGFIDAECLHLSKLIDASQIKIPNVGFQKISSDTSNLNLISKCYYFVHSYCLNFNNIPKTYQTILAGQEELYIGVQINNLWGFQFHPEKSQIMGLELSLIHI